MSLASSLLLLSSSTQTRPLHHESTRTLEHGMGAEKTTENLRGMMTMVCGGRHRREGLTHKKRSIFSSNVSRDFLGGAMDCLDFKSLGKLLGPRLGKTRLMDRGPRSISSRRPWGKRGRLLHTWSLG